MLRLAPFLLAALPASAQPVSAPSGQPLEIIELFWDLGDEEEAVLRIRLLAPEIGRGRTFAEIEPDFLHLCRTEGLPRVTADRENSLIVVNMLDRPVAFGTIDPNATQFFEAFRAEGGDCVWQGL